MEYLEPTEYVDETHVTAQIDALIEKRMADPGFKEDFETHGRETRANAIKLAVAVLRTGNRFFDPNAYGWCMKDSVIGQEGRAAAKLLAAIGAADVGSAPSFSRGGKPGLQYTTNPTYYLLLEAVSPLDAAADGTSKKRRKIGGTQCGEVTKGALGPRLRSRYRQEEDQ